MSTGQRPWVGALLAGTVLAVLVGTAAFAGGHKPAGHDAVLPSDGTAAGTVGRAAPLTTAGPVATDVTTPQGTTPRLSTRSSAGPVPGVTTAAGTPIPLGRAAGVAAGDYLLDAVVSAPVSTIGTVEQTVGAALPARAADFMASPSTHHVTAEVRITGPGDVFTIVGRSTRIVVTSITLAPASWGFVVRGQQITSATHSDLVMHGVNAAAGMDAGDFAQLASSFPAATLVRVTVDEECWDPFFTAAQQSQACNAYDTPTLHGSVAYRARVTALIKGAEAAGRTVVIGVDHAGRDDAGYVPDDQQDVLAPDQHTLAAYRDLAGAWSDDVGVIFETFNEPKMQATQTYAPDGLAGPVLWRDGGRMSAGYDTWHAPGEQQIVDTIRATGAANLVMVQGESWGEDLSPVEKAPILGTNLLYSVHAYNPGQVTYDDQLDTLSAPLFDPNGPYRYAGFVSEFGTTEPDGLAGDPGSKFLTSAMDWAAAHHLGWAAWGWFPSSWGDAYALLQAYQPLELNGKGKTVASRF